MDRVPPSEEEISARWPLHWLVWKDDHLKLKEVLSEKLHDKESKDPRGRTPLHLSVCLRRLRCAQELLNHGADVLALNRHQYSVLNEAVCSGSPDLIALIQHHRELQQQANQARQIPNMLQRLQSGADFYIEMTWDFSSWVPFLSRMCPSDTYKIWKKGSTVRVDTTLIGFEHFQWQRGNQSFIFEATDEGARFLELDHDRLTAIEHQFKLVRAKPSGSLLDQQLTAVQRLSAPVISTVVDTESVAFQRQKSGIWGFRSDRSEVINGFNAKVFSAAGLDVVTRTRLDHLPPVDQEQYKNVSVSPLVSFLGGADDSTAPVETPAVLNAGTSVTHSSNRMEPQLSHQNYFLPPEDPEVMDAIGRETEVYSRVRRLKATVWLAENYPLSLQDQIMPIIDLMSLNNAHFAKLKDFIALQMPAGFPVKFEIPLFHVMSARVTFGNINGHTSPVPYISLHTEQASPTCSTWRQSSEEESEVGVVNRKHPHLHRDNAPTKPSAGPGGVGREELINEEVCIIHDEAFKPPEGFVHTKEGQRTMADQEEELVQMAIRQSLMEEQARLAQAGSSSSNSEDRDSQQNAPYARSPSETTPTGHIPQPRVDMLDSDLELALALSRAQTDEEEMLRRREEEELQRVLQLSLQEK